MSIRTLSRALIPVKLKYAFLNEDSILTIADWAYPLKEPPIVEDRNFFDGDITTSLPL
jgi:hypothetical protein